MTIGSILRLEVFSSPKNYEKKSMSFPLHAEVDELIWVMGHNEILLVHTNYETKESRSMVVKGADIFSQLKLRVYKDQRGRKKLIAVYQY